MNFDLDWLKQILKTPRENQNLEFKEAKNQYSYDTLLKYCVALANERGGQLVLGVTNKLPREIVGTKAFLNIDKTTQDVFQKLNFRINITELKHLDKRVLVIDIPSRPPETPIAVEGRYFMRVGEQLQPMTPDQLRLIMNEGKPDFLEEIAMANLSGEQVIALLDTQSYFDLLKRPYPSSRDKVLEKFVTEELIRNDEGTYSIKNIGAILFAKSLRKFSGLKGKAPRVVVYDGTNKLNTRLTQDGNLGYASGFTKLVEYVMAQVPSNEVIESTIRKTVTMFPHIAIRELIANALIHQDFTTTGMRIMIELYDNRLEISNPGLPSIPLDRFIDDYQSRNEKLAGLLRRFGICEEQGSGIDKVVESAEIYQLPAPNFTASNSRTIVKLFAHKEFKDMSKEERIRACYQHCCLLNVSGSTMTNSSLRERFGLPKEKSERISVVIRNTLDRELIIDRNLGGSKRDRKYVPHWA